MTVGLTDRSIFGRSRPGRSKIVTTSIALFLFFLTTFLSNVAVAQEQQRATAQEPVKPFSVKMDPKKLRELSRQLTPGAAPPEGEPGPIGPIPPRRPIYDPTVQGAARGPSGDSAAAAFDAGEAFDQLSAPIVNVAGMTFGDGPPDTIGDVGPNHYVQMINATTFQVFDKDGNPDPLGVVNLRALWQAAGQAGTECDSQRGDPTVVYDHLADRWLLSQFALAVDTGMCIAISQTPDPTAGSWNLYYFDLGADPDYPKFGVWPDGYYMSSYEGSSLGVFAFDRTAMLNGQATAWFKLTIGSLGAPGVRNTRILPSDLDGPPPPAGTPNYFVRTIDDQQDPGNPVDRIQVWSFTADWSNGIAIFALVDSLSPAPFQTMLCDRTGGGFRDCVPQPDSTQNVDALSNRPMMQLKYRNFGGHASMVFNQTIDVSGSMSAITGITPANEVAGIRWYELRNNGGTGNWSINDQGTFAPQPIIVDDEAELLHRWMGSAAMDKDGNIAIGYSISNDDDDNGEEVYPGIRYAGRLAGDLAGQLAQGEQVILNGAFSVSAAGRDRWGDYSAMSVDPVDDCTFWFTTHAVDSLNNRPTRIASFKFLSCDETDLAISKTASPDPAIAGNQLIYKVTVDNLGPNLATDVIVTDTLPAGVAYVVDTDSCVEAPAGTLTCDIGNIPAGGSSSFEIKVLVDADLVANAGGPTTITNVASVTSDQADTDETNNSVTLNTIVDDTADLKVTKLCKPDGPLYAGDTGICEIFVDNLGPSYARDVLLVDEHVANGEFTISSPTPGCVVVDDVVTCDLGTLSSQAPDNRAKVVVELSALEQVDINNTAQASSSTFDPDLGNNTAEDGFSVTPVADLEIGKSDSPDPVVAGELLTYDLTVLNNGPSTAVNVVIEDIVPAGVSIESVSTTSGGTCNAGVPGDSTQPTTCTFDSLSSGSMGDMQISARVLPDTLGILHNDAEVSSDTFDDNNANNLASTDTQVESVADLEVVKTDSPDPVAAGAPLAYTIDVVNNGPSTALAVMLTDTLPAEVIFDNASASNGGPCNFVVPDVVDCDLGTMDPGEMVTVFINVTVDPSVPPGTVITNFVNVTSATTDPDGASDSEDTTVAASADLWIDKTGNFQTNNPSGTLEYVITVHNDAGCSNDDPQVCGDGGPSDAQNVVVVDPLPLDPKKLRVQFVSEDCVYDKSSHTVTCTTPTLPVGSFVEHLIQMDVKGKATEIVNTATVSSDTSDPNGGNNSDTFVVSVKGGKGDPGGPK